MTEQQAQKAANIALGLVAVGAAYVVLKNPSIRRAVWRFASTALRATGPWFVAEARQAWERSDSQREAAPADSAAGEHAI